MNNILKLLIILLLLVLFFIFYDLNENFTISNKKKKIIVCFFGTISRSIKYTFPSIKKNIIDELKKKYNVDIYVFNLNSDGYKVDGIILDNNDIKIIPYKYYEEYKQKDLDKIIDSLCKKTKCKMRSDYTDTAIRNAIRQMYSEYRVGLFLEKNYKHYDGCLVCGPDYFIANKVNLTHIDKSLNQYLFFTSQVNDAQGYTNGFYFGKIKVVTPILKRYQNIKKYFPTNYDYEYFVKQSCKENSIKRVPTDIVFFKIRASKNVKWQGGKNTSFLSKENKEKVYREYEKVTKKIFN